MNGVKRQRKGKSVKKTDVKKLEKELKKKSKQIEELESRIRYLQADFENYRKQIDKEKEEFERQANERLIKEMLGITDDFERAVERIKDKQTKEGMEMILKNMMNLLEKKGLKRIEALGKKFDPYYHEALLSEKSDKEEGTILEELQKGYMLHSKVIRHSKVKVAKN
jgi:molecular chaperone GrpE